jgi:hypothetical protein
MPEYHTAETEGELFYPSSRQHTGNQMRRIGAARWVVSSRGPKQFPPPLVSIISTHLCFEFPGLGDFSVKIFGILVVRILNRMSLDNPHRVAQTAFIPFSTFLALRPVLDASD